MNILLLSIGAKHALVSFFMDPSSGFDKVITTDCSKYSAGLYNSDAHYIVPRMKEEGYLPALLDICAKENIDAVIPSQEDELVLIAKNRQLFEDKNIKVISSEAEYIELCRDKLGLYEFLSSKGIDCVPTKDCYNISLDNVDLPAFLKPRFGAGSVGNMKISSPVLLEAYINDASTPLVLQPFMKAVEYGVDVYTDLISGEVTDIFVKEKIRMRAGETEKSLSVRIPEIEEIVKNIITVLPLKGPVDMDFFFYENKFYLLEINPRFGGGYPHAFGCNVNFPLNISNNLKGKTNACNIGNYPLNTVALKYTETYFMEK